MNVRKLNNLKLSEVKTLLNSIIEANERHTARAKELLSALQEKPGMGFTEDNFLKLKWEKRSGSRLREFEVTQDGSGDFSYCFNVLKEYGASISNRFRGEGWKFAYWIFKNSIYRQQRKTQGYKERRGFALKDGFVVPLPPRGDGFSAPLPEG